MVSHFEEEMDVTFLSFVSVFIAPESGPVGIFKDFKSQLLCLQGPTVTQQAACCVAVRVVTENIFSAFFPK